MTAQIISVIILLVLSATFSATETAYISLSLIQLKEMQGDRKSRAARLAYKLSQDKDTLLTTILIGNNVVNIAASSLVSVVCMQMFGSRWVSLGTGVLTVLVLIFGEITPKQVAMRFSKEIASFMAFPLQVIIWVLYPIIFVFRGISKIVQMLTKDKRNALTVEGIMHVVDAAEDSGVVEEYESDLMQRVLHFSDNHIKNIMTHRTDVFSIEADTTIKDSFASIVESGFSRIPIYRDSKENIVGVVLVRNIMRAMKDGKQDDTLMSICNEPIFVPETKKVDQMFFQFKEAKFHIAIVLDEYGGFSGIITMEDVVEQLFGEIYDEHEKESEERIEESEKKEGLYKIKGETTFLQIVDELDLDFQNAEKEGTIAAYLMSITGDIPSEGDRIKTPVGEFMVSKMQGNKITEVYFLQEKKEEDL